MLRCGLTCTPPARTIVDLAQLATRAELVAWWTTAVVRREVSVDGVLAVAARLHHRGGTGLVHEVAVELGPEFESFLEVVLGGGLGVGRGGWWVPQLTIRHRGRVVARADFADPSTRTIVEADGFAFHGSTAQQRRDRQRDRLLARIGDWQTLRYGADDILRRLTATLEEIEAVRALRARRLAS